MAENIKLAEFDIDVSAVLKDTQELKQAIDDLKLAQANLKLQGKENDAEFIANEARLKAINIEYNNNIKSLTELNSVRIKGAVALSDDLARQELFTSALNTQAVSIAEAREQNKLLNRLRNEANVNTAKGQEEIAVLNKRLDENNALIKNNVDALSQQKINVGNYSESIKDALGSMNPFNTSITVFIQNIQQAGGLMPFLSNGLKAVSTGIVSMTRAALAFLATPIGAVIGAIGLALGLVINALTSTQAGMDKITAVTRPLAAIFEVFLGVIQDVGTFLIKAFSNPLDSLQKIYDFVKDKVIKQFEALKNVVVGLFTLDFDQMKEGFKQLGDNAKETFGQIAGVGKQFVGRMKEGVRLGQELDALTKEYEQSQIRNAELVPQLNAQLKESNLLARDTTKTTQEREEAAKKALALGKQINDLKKEELGLELAIAENEAARNDTSREEFLEIAKIKGQIADVDAETAQQAVRLQSNLLTIQKEAAAQQAKVVDEQIKKQKELLDLYIAQAGTRAKTLQEELTLEESLSQKKKEILDDELKAKKLSQEAYQKAIIELDEGLALRRAELAVDNALREIEANKMSLEQRREDAQFLSAELAEQRKSENATILLQEQELAKLRLEQGLINQQEFDDAIRELTETNRIANKEIDDERLQIEKEEKAELRAIEFQEELARLQEEGATKFEIEQARIAEERRLQFEQLEADKKNGLISEKLYNSKLNQINADARRVDLQNEKTLAQQKIAIANQLFSGIANLVGEESAAGKAVSLAQALINTYEGITAALDTKPFFPLGLVAAATAATTGFAAVKNIASTKLPNASGSTTAPSIQGDFQSLGSNQSNATQIASSGNAAVQQQIAETAQAGGLTETMEAAVERGTMRGSSQGSEQGLTNLSDNNNIRNLSTF